MKHKIYDYICASSLVVLRSASIKTTHFIQVMYMNVNFNNQLTRKQKLRNNEGMAFNYFDLTLSLHFTLI